MCEGQESGGGLASWLWHAISQEVTLKMLVGVVVIRNWTGAGGPTSALVQARGCRSGAFFAIWASPQCYSWYGSWLPPERVIWKLERENARWKPWCLLKPNARRDTPSLFLYSLTLPLCGRRLCEGVNSQRQGSIMGHLGGCLPHIFLRGKMSCCL